VEPRRIPSHPLLYSLSCASPPSLPGLFSPCSSTPKAETPGPPRDTEKAGPVLSRQRHAGQPVASCQSALSQPSVSLTSSHASSAFSHTREDSYMLAALRALHAARQRAVHAQRAISAGGTGHTNKALPSSAMHVSGHTQSGIVLWRPPSSSPQSCRPGPKKHLLPLIQAPRFHSVAGAHAATQARSSGCWHSRKLLVGRRQECLAQRIHGGAKALALKALQRLTLCVLRRGRQHALVHGQLDPLQAAGGSAQHGHSVGARHSFHCL
jgi:hypothetical protein